MGISSLALHNFRNVSSAHLNLSPHINFVFGLNGAGKTSALEAIYFALTGKSFRTRSIFDYIKRSHDGDASSMMLKLSFSNSLHVEDIEFTSFITQVVKGQKARSNVFDNGSEKLKRFSSLTYSIPCFYFSPEALNFLSGDPIARRGFIDWLLFHVEHGYRDIYLRYKHVLKNRNAVLASFKKNIRYSLPEQIHEFEAQLQFWTDELIKLNNRIAELRDKHLKEVFQSVADIVMNDLDLSGVGFHIDYSKGWSAESIEESFELSFESEKMVGYTLSGVHKADIVVRGVDGLKGKYTFSRGQTKLVTLAFVVAAAEYIKRIRNTGIILMLDDVFSELDSLNSKKVSGIISGLEEHQILLTSAVDSVSSIDNYHLSSKHPIKMFHVKHGEFIEEK